MKSAAIRAGGLLLLASLLPACGVGGGGTLTPTTAPQIPSDVVVRAGNGSVTIDWAASALGASYEIFRSVVPQGPFFPVSGSPTAESATRYIDGNLVNGTTYYYEVVAKNQFGRSAPSAVVAGTPGFTAKAACASSVASSLLAVLQDGTVWEWGRGPSLLVNNAPVQKQGLADITSVACGGGHALVLRSDGTIWAWGNESAGQLGNGVSSSQGLLVMLDPVPVSNMTGAVAVSVGYGCSLALRYDGTVWAWGDNEYGQLGLGSVTPINVDLPQQVPGLSDIIAISAGLSHCLALRGDGLVFAWGMNSSGQLGTGSAAAGTPLPPTEVTNLTGVLQISAGVSHSLVVRSDGSVWAWGVNDSGQLGNGAVSPTPVPSPTRALSLSGIVAVSAGASHSLAVGNDGRVWAWGSNSSGQLGFGAVSPTPVPTPGVLSGISRATFVAASSSSSLAVLDDGTVATWGSNLRGELGNGTGTTATVPAQLMNFNGAVGVTAGSGFSAAARKDGSVWTWGANTNGQLGYGSTSLTPTSTPAPVGGLSSAVAVSSGGSFSVALRSDGLLFSWGMNSSGQLGTGSVTAQSSSPVPVSGLSGIVAISSGQDHSLAIQNNGTVWAWGANSSGQVGNGASAASMATPYHIPSLTGISAVAGGSSHSIALGSDGTVWTWGSNSIGQLGLGTTGSPVLSPTPVPGMSGVVAIGAGYNHTLVARTDGTVWAWGAGDLGQLGNGAFASSNVPVKVSDLTGVTAVSGGAAHCLALRGDGSVWAWGDNTNSQLGNLIPNSSGTPVPVLGLSGVLQIAAGPLCSFARLQNQTIFGWGMDQSNQLGYVPVNQSISPVFIPH